MRRLFIVLLACALAVIPTSFRWVVWAAPIDAHALIFPEFRGVVLFAPDLFLLLSVLVAGLYLGRNGEALDRAADMTGHGLFLPWALLAAWAGASPLWAGLPGLALYHAVHLALTLTLGLLTAAILQPHDLHLLCRVLVVSAVVQSMIAMLQTASQHTVGLSALGELPFSTGRGAGLSVNPNNLAGYLLLAWFAAWIVRERSGTWRLIHGLMAVILLGFLATGSRAGILALGAGSIGMSLLLQRGQRVALAGGAVALMLIVLLRPEALMFDRLIFEFKPAWTVIRDSPLTGAGAAHSVIRAYQLTGIDHRVLLPVHNLYLMVWAEFGLVGLILTLLGFWQIIRVARQAAYPEAKIAICGVVALMISGVFDYYFWGDLRNRTLMMIFMGLVWGLIQQRTIDPQNIAQRAG